MQSDSIDVEFVPRQSAVSQWALILLPDTGNLLWPSADRINRGVLLFESQEGAEQWAVDRLVEAGHMRFDDKEKEYVILLGDDEQRTGAWHAGDVLDQLSQVLEFCEYITVEPVIGSACSMDEPEKILNAFNEAFGYRLNSTAKRRRLIRQRLREPWWKENWRDALTRAATTPFCNGQNDRGWKATIDWFLRPDTVARLLEGRYDEAHTYTDNAAVRREADNASAFERLERLSEIDRAAEEGREDLPPHPGRDGGPLLG